jgi:hypothetical protein
LGQERICAATHVLCTEGFSAEVEALYMTRAGASVTSRGERGPGPGSGPGPGPGAPGRDARASSPNGPASLTWLSELSPGAREVGEGAFAALVALETILAGGTT